MHEVASVLAINGCERLSTVRCRRQVDFNLYGMGFIRFSRVLFRGALPATPLLPPHGWLHRTEMHHPGQSGPGPTLVDIASLVPSATATA